MRMDDDDDFDPEDGENSLYCCECGCELDPEDDDFISDLFCPECFEVQDFE